MQPSLVEQNPILTVSQIYDIEKASEGANPPLMSLAGLAIAARIKRLCPDTHTHILFVAGPGNNGADAIIAAAHLFDWGYHPAILTKRTVDSLPPEAQNAWYRWENEDNALFSDFPEQSWHLIVDGLFGIGLDRPIEGVFAEWINHINHYSHHQATILSIDIPSGLQADHGIVLGCCVQATHTMTFIAHKPGMLTNDGPDYCGEILLDTLQTRIPDTMPSVGQTNDPTLFQGFLSARKKNCHKGNFGTVGLIGGTDSMVGALLLAARACLKFGAGKVIAGSLAKTPLSVDYLYPEIIIRSSQRLIELVNDEAIDLFTVLVLGPGMGDLVYTGTPVIRTALCHQLPLVIDADALNQIAVDRYLQNMLTKREGVTIITPHPGEAMRLLDASSHWVQANRLEAAQALAKQFNCITILKGCGTIIAEPSGKWRINRTGNPGMASGGMGDCLSGMIAALLAQQVDPFEAACAAVCLHGAAADACLDAGIGPVGLTASELIDHARGLLNRLS